MQLALQVFNVAIPVLLCVLAGFFWVKKGMPFDNRQVTPLLMHLAVPCLLLASFDVMELPLNAVLKLLAATTVAHVFFAGLGWLFLRLMRLDVRSYLTSMMFGNNANLGLPLCMLAFGEQGLQLGLGYMIVNTVGLFTAGIWINSGSMSPGALLKTPALYAAACAMGLLLSGLELPEVLRESMEILGGMAIPLMLLALGAALFGLKVRNLGASLALSIFKLLMGVGVGLLLSWLFRLEGATHKVFMLQNIMPVAVFNYLLAEHYGRESSQVAGLIVVSSLLGLASIPLALAVLL